MARSFWDWDEALFLLGMRSYDVTQHHPHPPGFPVYIGLGRLVRLVIHNDFCALQAINLVAAVLIFPAIFMLARELRLRFATATVAGVLCAFFPNVWFFGGTAFSDIPSIVLVVYAAAFLLRGRRSAEAYLVGTFLLALAAGIRPQNLMIGLAPGLIATWVRARQSWRDVVFAVLIGVIVMGVAFGGAIAATGSFDGYMSAVRAHGDYISRVDSFRSPERPPLWRLFDRFFIKQYDCTPLGIVVSLFVAVSIVAAIRERNRDLLINFLTFGPFAIMAWLMLDRFSISRFAIGYIPMFAIFAADGIGRVARKRAAVEGVIGGGLALAFAAWAFPSFAVVRGSDSPTVQGVAAVDHLDPRRDDLFVGVAMHPFIQVLAPNKPYVKVLDERALPLSIGNRRPWLLTEIDLTKPGGYVFHRPHDQLWSIARRHYFDVALEPVTRQAQFVSGWYQAERSDTDEWRWMSGHSVTRLPAAAGDTVLRLEGNFPEELLPEKPNVTIMLNGDILDRFVPSQEHWQRDYHANQPHGAPATLEIVVDKTYTPRDDGRALAFELRYLAWGPE
ncbi:MAG TPA: hypothetical protein VG323_16935 [Thermoanaerobaculia bacterium]|nr:hypothetical protein [Thermoanaerobaculia bacterium]